MRQLEVSASIYNLPPQVTLSGSLHQHEDFLAQAGYAGFQYGYVRRVLGKNVSMQLARDGHITSLHQSFVDTHDRSAKGLALRGILSSVEKSIKKLQTVQEAAGRKLPLVVHPNEQYLDKRAPRRHVNYLGISEQFATLLHQPTVEVMADWGVVPHDSANSTDESATRMMQLQRVKGFGGIALDIHHLLSERGGQQLGVLWCKEFSGALAMHGALVGPSELQLSFRPDFQNTSQPEEKVREDVRRVLDGNMLSTHHGQIIKAIADGLPPDQQRLRITVETPPSAFPNGMDYMTGNQQLVEAIYASPLAA